jgi:uncharacterized repeat protein (TIGR01451 family)
MPVAAQFRGRLYRVLAALLFVLPTAAGRDLARFGPPPPRFVLIASGLHVIATWPRTVRPALAPAVTNSTAAGDATLLSQTVSPATLAANGTLHYSIVVTNATTVTQSFHITDTLPMGLAYITGTATGGLVYNADATKLISTTTLNAFQGKVITTTGAPIYYELLDPSHGGQNICQQDFTGITGCDNQAVILAGWAFRYLGVDYTTITLDSNGFVMPGLPGPHDLDTDSQNQPMPAVAAPNNVIAPFWDDLHLKGTYDSGGGDWLWATVSDNGADYLVVEWHIAQKKSDSGSFYSFQVWIQRFVEHITFAYPYATPAFTGDTSSASIGFENSNGTLGSAYLYNGAGQVPGPGAELELDLGHAFASAQFGFDVRAPHALRGCVSVANTVVLANDSGTLTDAASALTNLFGPCQFLALISR